MCRGSSIELNLVCDLFRKSMIDKWIWVMFSGHVCQVWCSFQKAWPVVDGLLPRGVAFGIILIAGYS